MPTQPISKCGRSQIQIILSVLRESPLPVLTTVIADSTGIKRSNVWVLLLQLEQSGVVIRADRPKWRRVGTRWVLKSLAGGLPCRS